jgi:beta-lactam-binding protein with PASTA domain
MTSRERLHWLLRMGVMLFILASVAFLSALTAMRLAIQGREVTMPDVVGKNAAQASQILRGRGLTMKIEDRIYSHFPVDAVARQSPPPDMQMKIGQDAHVVLSLGPQTVTIPQLEDRSLRAAQVELLRGRMQVGEVSSAFLPGTSPDTVLQQFPAPGTTDVTSPHVNLLVALGPRPTAYVMPDLIGLPTREAQSRLTAAGLRVSKITASLAPDPQRTPPGTIAGQTPSPGQRVDTASEIELEEAD